MVKEVIYYYIIYLMILVLWDCLVVGNGNVVVVCGNVCQWQVIGVNGQ